MPELRRQSLAFSRHRDGAARGGHDVRRLDVGDLDFPLLRDADAFVAEPPPDIVAAQDAIAWAQHVVIILPLWHGGAPALLKGFVEQVFRYGFALTAEIKHWPPGMLGGRSARLVVTMGMPGVIYRWIFGAFGIRSIERSVLRMAGFGPVRRSLLGAVGPGSAAGMIRRLHDLGLRAG